MGEMAGYEGHIYYRHGYFKGTVSFAHNSPAADVITATSLTASHGFVASDTIEVAGASSATNNSVFDIGSVSVGASTITLSASSTLASGSSSTSVTIDTKPGTQLAGFFNWTLNYGGEALETTDFADSGKRTYISGLTGWTATATKHYMTSDSRMSWITSGSTVTVRFFLRYEATPTASSTAYYLQGSAKVTGTDTTTPVDGTVDQTLNFQGTGALSIVSRATSW